MAPTGTRQAVMLLAETFTVCSSWSAGWYERVASWGKIFTSRELRSSDAVAAPFDADDVGPMLA